MSESVPVPSPWSPPSARRRRTAPLPACLTDLTYGTGHRLPGRPGGDEGAVVEGGFPDDLRFDVRTHTSTGPLTVTVIGEVDCQTAPSLRAVLRDVLAGPDLSGDLVVDLSGVTFLDVCGLTVLAVAHHVARSAGRVVGIRCGSARAVIRPLQITGLWNDLTIIDQRQTDT